jgi:hypothetical protein
MKRLLLLPLLLLGLACEPAITPPPVPPPISAIFKEIFHSTVPDPTGVHAPREAHSCAAIVDPPDASGHAYYHVLDPLWEANGWGYWSNCVLVARSVGRSIRLAKYGASNESTQTPILNFVMDSAPIFGDGAGHYPDPAATNPAVWARAYVQGV